MRNYLVIDFKGQSFIFKFGKSKQPELSALILAADRAGAIVYNSVGRACLKVPGYGVGQLLSESEVLALHNFGVDYSRKVVL